MLDDSTEDSKASVRKSLEMMAASSRQRRRRRNRRVPPSNLVSGLKAKGKMKSLYGKRLPQSSKNAWSDKIYIPL